MHNTAPGGQFPELLIRRCGSGGCADSDRFRAARPRSDRPAAQVV